MLSIHHCLIHCGIDLHYKKFLEATIIKGKRELIVILAISLMKVVDQ